MGEARRRANAPVSTVYHHTSSLRTNLIWMSGVVELEGRSKGATHPIMGEIVTDLSARRPCRDFPPLAWFTSSIAIPKCLLHVGLLAVSRKDGTPLDLVEQAGSQRELLVNGMVLRRLAIGFAPDPDIITPWPEHYGYQTNEGRELNETAREAGDEPDHWYVAEAPVDVLRSTEIWGADSIFRPKLRRYDGYLADVHRMVRLCREKPEAIIPPSWIGDKEVEAMIKASNGSV